MPRPTHALDAWSESAGRLHLHMIPLPGDAERGGYTLELDGSGDWEATQEDARAALAKDRSRAWKPEGEPVRVSISAARMEVEWSDGNETWHPTPGELWRDLCKAAAEKVAARMERA